MAEPSELRNLIAEATTEAETAAEPVRIDKPESAVDAPEKSDAPSGDRARGPDGKFLPRDAAPAEETDDEPPETT
jgi:hypothetical protein